MRLILFVILLCSMSFAAEFTWSSVNVNELESPTRKALREFADAYSGLVVDSSVWVASNAVPYEKGEFRLFQMSKNFDAKGVTFLLLKEPHRSGAEVVGSFFLHHINMIRGMVLYLIVQSLLVCLLDSRLGVIILL